MKIKVRKSWGDLKPITRRIDSSKIYKRKSKFGNNFSQED